MNVVINVELRDKLKQLYSDVYEILGSEEFAEEKNKCEELFDKLNDDVELSEEEEEYCRLFGLENLREFIREVE